MQGTILSTESKVLYKQTKQYPHECGAGEISCKTVIFHSWLEGCMLLTLGSFSNDDGDGSETVKTAIGLLNKKTGLHVHHAFLYIS